MVEMPSKPRKNKDEIGFVDVSKTKSIIDYELSRYACYLVVQNGDPRKEVIAFGQTYFARVFRDAVNNVTVITDSSSGRVVTARYGS